MAYKRGGYYYATAYDHGRRVYIKAGPSKKVAEQIERDLKTKIVKGEYLGIYDEKRVLLRDFIPRYLAYSQANKRPESASRDERSLKALAESFGDRYLSEITCEIIEAHKERRLQSVKPATVNKELAALKHLYTLAMKWKYVSRNPVKEVKLLKEPPGRLRYLLPEQYYRLLHACALHSATLKAIVVSARNTGMRQGELIGLKWTDLDWEKRTLQVKRQVVRYYNGSYAFSKPKSRNGNRTVMLGQQVIDVLRAHQDKVWRMRKGAGANWKEFDLIFPTRVGTPIQGCNLRRAFRKLLKVSGLPRIRFHDLRHTAASLMLNYGISVLVVSRRLGHAKASITLDVYGHLVPGKQEEAAELMDELMTPVSLEIAPKLHPNYPQQAKKSV